MNKLLETLGVWYLLRSIAFMMLGEAFIRPLTHTILREIKEWPRISHYLKEHGGRYFECIECKFPHATNVDSLS